MRCETCGGTGTTRRARDAGFDIGLRETGNTKTGNHAAPPVAPCYDCGGTGIAHCCDGICEQPDADTSTSSSRHRASR
jgi:hypothetical protein